MKKILRNIGEYAELCILMAGSVFDRGRGIDTGFIEEIVDRDSKESLKRAVRLPNCDLCRVTERGGDGEMYSYSQGVRKQDGRYIVVRSSPRIS